MNAPSWWRAIVLSLCACGTAPSGADTLNPPDGAVHIVGDKTLEPVLRGLYELYVERHPGARITFALKNPPVGMDGIIAGVSPIAPIAHEAWDGEIEGFERLNGYRPVDVRIARIGFVGLGRTAPPGVYVHAGNPLRPLTIDEVGRILTTGLLPSDVRRWSQLGVGGDLAAHAIHVYGTRDDGREITTLRSSRFGGRPFVRHYEALPDDAAVLQAVAGDRYGIGLVWSADPRRVPADVRRLPLAAAGQPASIGEYADVRAGRYPLARYLHVYLNRAPGAVLDPLAQEYLRLALSADGQRLVESLKDTAQGFVPLTAGELLSETAKLETGPR